MSLIELLRTTGGIPSEMIMNIRNLLLVVSLVLLPPSGMAQSPEAAGSEKLGKVSFPTSCDPKVQAQFERGVALLHSFSVQVGRKVFEDVLKADPSCAIAYWGIGVNRLLNPFGGQPPENVLLDGRAAVDKGKAIGAKTQRERDYIEAIGVLYGHGMAPWRSRVLTYEKAMERLAQRYPDDPEASIFYALALNIAADLSDQTYAKQLKAAAVLELIFATQPDHPGVAHYLIHSYDYPPIAEKGLPAARRYASIAPAAAHALHMPSHIFTRVGAWQESIDTNRRAEQVARKTAGPSEILHPIDYQAYAHLQLAQDGEVKRIIERVGAETATDDRAAGVFAKAAISARYALERGDWRMAAQLQPGPSRYPYTEAITHFARALGAARANDAASARKDLEQLALLRDTLRDRKDNYWTEIVEIQRLGAQAWVLFAEGKPEEARAMMREAAEREDKTEKSPVTPGPLAPARELLGEMLLLLNQPAQALKEFETSARREPNRFRGLAGAARAAEMAGDQGKAAAFYAKLMALAKNADSERQEVRQAKAFLAAR
jgi:tetratricopeptide (TPR) repeat protein